MKVDQTQKRLRPVLQRTTRHILVGIFLLAGISWISIGKVSQAADALLVKISIEGEEKVVATKATTVGDVLKEQGVALEPLDVVEPGQSTPLSNAFNINIYRARPVMVVDGSRRITITTAQRSAHLIAKAAGLSAYPEDRFEEALVQNFVREGFIGRQITIHRSTPVTVHVDGHDLELRTQAKTVEELFSEKDIKLEDKDFASLPLSTRIKAGLEVTITRVGEEVIVREEKVPFTTRTIRNFDLPYGEQQVEEEGRPGKVLITYRLTRHDKRVVQKRLLSKTTVSQPQERVVVLGMKPVTVYTSNAQILAALRQCETGGNYRANTGNGYYGAYQFSSATWNRWNTDYARADLAPPAVQDATTLKNARASAGGFASQHPGCYNKLSLPKFPF